jgi:N4-gp56 family major capsid protein
MKAGTSVTYANGTARTDVNTPMTLSVQRSITRSLKSQKAKKISRMLSSSPNYGTKAIEPAYIAFSHTNVEGDIRNINGFIPVADYGQRSPLCEEELGSAEDVRYILSADLDGFADAGGAEDGSGESMMSTGGTSADVPRVLCVCPLKGQTGDYTNDRQREALCGRPDGATHICFLEDVLCRCPAERKLDASCGSGRFPESVIVIL